jgi:hypothetical protein
LGRSIRRQRRQQVRSARNRQPRHSVRLLRGLSAQRRQRVLGGHLALPGGGPSVEGARLDSPQSPLPSAHLQQEQVALIGLRAAKIDCTALLACFVIVFADPRWEPEICTRAHLQDSVVLVHRLPEHSAVRGRPLAHPAHLVAGARLVPRPPRSLDSLLQVNRRRLADLDRHCRLSSCRITLPWKLCSSVAMMGRTGSPGLLMGC